MSEDKKPAVSSNQSNVNQQPKSPKSPNIQNVRIRDKVTKSFDNNKKTK